MVPATLGVSGSFVRLQLHGLRGRWHGLAMKADSMKICSAEGFRKDNESEAGGRKASWRR
jgi:hypothetical protein